MRTLLIILSIFLVTYLLFIFALYISGRRSEARAIGGFIPDCIVLFKNLLQDNDIPKRHKFLVGLLIGYLASPIDLVPDFIPVAGQLDDAIIVVLVLRVVLKGAGTELATKHWKGPKSSLNLLLRLARIQNN